MSVLKKIALTAALGFASAGAAFAADLPARGPAPAPAPVFVAAGWTGFYAGLNVGYGCCGDDTVGVLASNGNGWTNVSNLAPKGLFGGIQLGYNWQRGNMVYGLEADIQASGMKRSFTALAVPATVGAGLLDIAGSNRVEWFGSIRPRLGFLVTPNTLLYGTGGLGVMGSKYRVAVIDAGLNNALMASNSTKIGWVVGAGIEHKFNSNWSAKLEYQYHSYGKKTITAPVFTGGGVPNGVTVSTIQTPNFHTVRIGLNYQFVTGGGAVVAKY